MAKLRIGDLYKKEPQPTSAIDLLRAKRKELETRAYERINDVPLDKRKYNDLSPIKDGDTKNDLDNRFDVAERDAIAGNPGTERLYGSRETEYDQEGNAIDSKGAMARSFLDNTVGNAAYGLGTYIGGLGDIAQVSSAFLGSLAGADFNKLMLDGNFISKALQDYGASVEDANASYIPEEIQNPEFKASIFLNPEFWSTHGGQFIPQLIEILGTAGVAALSKKVAQGGVKKLLKNVMEEQAERIATKGAKELAEETAKGASQSWWRKNIIGEVSSTTKGLYKGSKSLEAVQGTGRGIAGRLMNDKGTLNEAFGMAIQGVTGGAITNLTVSARNASEVFNTYKEMYQKDEFGNTILDESGEPVPLFSKEELGEMASDTFKTNMQYMLADMLSWGMTFGGGWKALGSMGKAIPKGPNVMSKVAPQLMSKSVMPLFTKAGSSVARRGGKWAGKALFEGLEEQVQESYEEWSKMKAYHDVHGSMEGYQGNISQDYDMKSGIGPFSSGFWEFLNSKDSEAIRAISMGLGAIAGGSFNIGSLINKQANTIHGLTERSEMLRKIFEKGTEDRAIQEKYMHDQMSELIIQNKGGLVQEVIQNHFDEGRIDEEDVARYGNLYNSITESYDKIKDLNIAGKKAFMLNTAKELYFQSQVQNATELFQKNKESILSNLESVPQEERTQQFENDVNRMIKKEEDVYRSKINGLAQMLSKTKSNKTNLLLGKKAEAVDFDVNVEYDEFGNANINFEEIKAPQQMEQDPESQQEVEEQEETIYGMNREDYDKLSSDQKYDQMVKHGLEKAKKMGSKAKEMAKKIFEYGTGRNSEETEKANEKAQETEASAEIDPEIQKEVDANQAEIDAITKQEQDLKEGEQLTQEQIDKRAELEDKNKSLLNNNAEPKPIPEEVNAVDPQPEQNTFENEDVYESEPGSEFIVTKKDEKEFESTGKVGSHVIGAIAEKINNEQELTDVEKKIKEKFSKEVDEAVEMDIAFLENELNDPNLSKKDRKLIMDVVLSSRKRNVNSRDSKPKDLDKKPTLKDSENWTENGRFKREALEEIQNGFENSKGKIKKGASKGKQFFTKLAQKSKNISPNTFLRDSDFGNNEYGEFTNSVQLNYAMNKMYPNLDINTYAVEDMQRTVGENALAFVLAGQIYIDERVWNQDSAFMHEFAHIYYELNKDTEEVQTQLKYQAQNKALVSEILRKYDDQIQYESTDMDGNPISLTKKQILTNSKTGISLYEYMRPQEREDFFNTLIEKKIVKEIPLLEQEIIADELFAASLEGPLSEKYNKFFQEKIQEEPKRKFLARRFWKKVKEKGEKFSDKGERKIFLESLSDEDHNKYTDNMESILKGFQKTTLSSDLSASARASRRDALDQQRASQMESIEDKISEEREKFLKGILSSQIMNDPNLDLEEIMDQVSFDEIFNTDRLQYANKLNFVIKDFTSLYNKGVSIANKSKNKRWKSLAYLDPERLRYKLISIARASTSGADFINNLSNSKFEDVSKFINWMDLNRDDMHIVLQTLSWHERNMSDVNSFYTYINNKGQASLELAINNREKTLMENIIDKVIKPFYPKERSKSASLQMSYQKLNTAASNIATGNFTNQDLYDVLKYFSTPEMDIESIWNSNRINIGGKVYPLKNAIYNLVTSKNGLLGGYSPTSRKFVQYEGTTPVFGLSRPEVRENGKVIRPKEGVKREVRTFIKSLVNENRKYTANLTVVHADDNQHPSRIVDNYLTRNFKEMASFAKMKNTNKDAFYQRYSHINKDGKGNRSNNLLDFLYNKFKSDMPVDLLEMGGIKNEFNEDKSVSLTDNDSSSDRLNQFVIFNKSFGKSSYLMDLGRFSDSSRAYYMEVPRINTDSIAKVSKDKIVFSDKAILRNVYNTHAKLGYKGTYSDFKKEIDRSIQDSIEFMEANLKSLAKDNTSSNPLASLLDSKGNLNEKGLIRIANFELNNIINGTNFNEIFFPSFRFDSPTKDRSGNVVGSENEALKRAKSGLSPMFSFPNLQVENIYVRDVMLDNGDEATDSAFYILEKHADRFKSAGGVVMPLGNAFKFLQTGVEMYNPHWKGKNVYNKGFGTILNDEVVAKNPSLKGIYELLKRRDEKYTSEMGEQTENLLDGNFHHLPIIITKSSNKNKIDGIPSSYNLDVMDIETINERTLNGDTSEIDEILDSHYYEEGSPIMFSGDNFGIQQVMDIDRDDVNSPIQFLKSLTTNMKIHGNEDLILGLLNDIHTLSQNQIENGYNIITKGDEAQARDFFKGLIEEDRVDQTQKAVLLDDKLSLKTPYLRELVKNTFANYVKKNGLKLKTPGGILREKPTLYKKPYRTSADLDANTGSSDVEFYRQDSKGKFYPGEVVIPNRMLDGSKKRNPIKARTYYTSGNMEENLYKAKREAKSRNTHVGKVFDENDNHIGYYAAGSSIMATRIPSHGPQSTGFFEVVDFTGEEGNNIQLPNQFKKIIGSDHDGDQVFVQHRGRGTKQWNSIFERMQEHYMNPGTQTEINMPIDFEDDAREAIAFSEKVYGKRDDRFVLPFSSKGREIAFKDTIASKGNVGIAADLHTTMRMMASYGVKLNKSIEINGKHVSEFADSSSESITINSAKLFNIILDNAKWGFSDKLGIDTNTINLAMAMTNLGYSLEEVAYVLNHPVAKEYSSQRSKRTGIFDSDSDNSVSQSLLDNKEFKLNKKAAKEIVIDSNLSPASNNQAIFDLIRYLDSITSNEVSALGSVLSVHNTMSVNPMEIESIIKRFNSVTSNEQNPNLTFPEDFKENPIIKNYLDTLRKNQQMQRSLDPSYRGKVSDVYTEIMDLSGKTFSKKEHDTLAKALNLFHTSHILGFNNIPESMYLDLTKTGHDRNIYDRLQAHMNTLSSTIVSRDTNNPALSKTALDTSLLFTKGLNFNFGGNNKYISLNNDFHQNMIDSELREQMISEFAELNNDLKVDLMMYDLMKNGWAGPNSLFPLFGEEMKKTVSIMSGTEFSHTDKQLSILRNRIIRNNPKMFPQYDNVLYHTANGFSIKGNIATTKPILLSQLQKGNPFIFRTQDASGNVKMVKFDGFTDDEIGSLLTLKQNLSSQDYHQEFMKKASSKLIMDTKGKVHSNPFLNYITVPKPVLDPREQMIQNELSTIVDDLKNGITVKDQEQQGRSMRSDWYNYANPLDLEEHIKVMEYPVGFEQSRKEENWSKYLEEKAKADSLKSILNPESVKKLSDKKLNEIYSSDKPLNEIFPSIDDDGPSLGNRDKFAYSEVLRPVILELTQRSAQEQSAILEKAAGEHNIKLKAPNKDISIIDKYLMSNNISSSHPAVQSVVKKMEEEYKVFLDEKSKHMTKLNEATDKLYESALGYKINDRGIIDTVKHLFSQIFSNKESFYRRLYGPIVVMEKITDAQGNVINNMRYKSPEEIAKGVADGTISEAQENFYKVTREISAEQIKYTGADSREGYIPHTAPSNMEAFSRRGLLGVLVNSKTLNEKIMDVVLDAKDPISGKMVKGVTFKQVEDWYNMLSKNGSDLKSSVEYTKLKYKAISLQKKGINQDGTPIRYSNVEMGSALGDVFIDRFSKSRSVASTDFPSMDLNKAFADYIHSSLFTHGNDKFSGFKRMLPLIDGVLAQLDRDGNQNMSEYVEKIWKDYFLKGSKQHNLRNLKALEAIGVSSDDVIDYLTKGSLVYWLGWKGLALGGGAYAIGNVLVGKYKNVVNEGKDAWVKGEKRFWLGKDGKFNISDPLKGWRDANEILKTAGFMDINVFDDVSVEEKSGIEKTLMSLALLPMSLTERWIQGVHFLGKLSDDQWDSLRSGEKLGVEEMNQIEDEVKLAHGKGYQATDQRMIQMYSWGKMMMQFSRWIPTNFYDKFAQEDINRYGEYYIGSYRKVYNTVQQAVDGRWSYKDFSAYRNSLPVAERRRLDAGLMGFGLSTVLIAGNSVLGIDAIDKAVADENVFADPLRLKYKLTPPAIAMTESILK